MKLIDEGGEGVGAGVMESSDLYLTKVEPLEKGPDKGLDRGWMRLDGQIFSLSRRLCIKRISSLPRLNELLIH